MLYLFYVSSDRSVEEINGAIRNCPKGSDKLAFESYFKTNFEK